MFGKFIPGLRPAAALTLTATLLATLLAACAPLPAAPPPTQPVPGADRYTLAITGVEVHTGEQITFTGMTTLPEGACLRSELTRDGDVVPWWPGDACTPVVGPTWNISVTLGTAGRPAALEQDAQYRLSAWWDGDPEGVVDVFYFDLAPPPVP